MNESQEQSIRDQVSALAVPRLIRIRTVKELTGYSRSELYRRIASGRFPAPLPKEEGERMSLWVLSEVVAHVQQRIARRTAH